MQNIFTNIKCSEIILYNANENWYIILYDLFSRLCYIATCGPFCKDAAHIIDIRWSRPVWGGGGPNCQLKWLTCCKRQKSVVTLRLQTNMVQ